MSQSDVDRLARLEAVDKNQAELAMEQANDFEDARAIIQDAPVAIKFRFRSDEDRIYGTGIVVLSMAPVDLKEFNSVIGNKEEYGKLSLDKGYRKFHSNIAELKQTSSIMSALTEDLNEAIRDEFSTPKTDWVPLIEARNEVGLQDELTKFLERIIEPEELEVTVELEVGLLDYSSDEDSEEEEESSERTTTKEVEEEADSVTLLCEPRVNPLQGEPVQSLELGDMLFVDLKDDQTQNPALLQVMERLRDERIGLIPAKISEISETSTGKLEIIVQFGKNVYGRALVNKGMNLMTPSALERREELTSSLNSVVKWGLIGLSIFIIGSILWYAFVFSGL